MSTYLGLSRLMYNKDAPGVLDKILGHVAFFCLAEELPALTSIVVSKGVGVPGHGIPVSLAEMDRFREKVFDYNWFDLYPPTADELKTAYDNRPP